MQQKNRSIKATHAQIFIFHANTPAVDNQAVCYVFSVRQVVEVLSHAQSQPVPFSPRHAEGIAQWRGRVLPVLSIEKCLGIASTTPDTQHRAVVVRSVIETDSRSLNELYGIIHVGKTIQQQDLPMACDTIPVPNWVADASLLAGAFRMPDRILLVVNIGQILNGK